MKYLSIPQVARELGVPLTTIRRLVKTGKCPGFYSGNKFYINFEKFVETLDEKKAD